MPIGAPDAFFRTRCPSMRQNSSIRLTGRGAYVDEYQSLVNNRVRKNAHTIIRKRLTVRLIGATAPIAARASLLASRLTPRGFPSPSGSRPFSQERPLGVFPGLAREPLIRLLRAWTGENPLQPRLASPSGIPAGRFLTVNAVILDSQRQGAPGQRPESPRRCQRLGH